MSKHSSSENTELLWKPITTIFLLDTKYTGETLHAKFACVYRARQAKQNVKILGFVVYRRQSTNVALLHCYVIKS